MQTVAPNNYVIYQALKDKIINKDEFDVIFIDKSDWFIIDENGIKNWEQSSEKIEFFWTALNKLEPYFLDKAKYYDYCDVIFPYVDLLPSSKYSFQKNFTKLVYFSHAKFYGRADFGQIIFEYNTTFDNTHFYDNAIFQSTTFKKDISFYSATFHQDAALVNTQFEMKAMFVGTIFKTLADFRNSDANKILFTNAHINKIDLFAFTYREANFLNLHNYPNQKLKLSTQNFINRETVRLIKSSLEKEHNITEANKYFPIEQDLYINELKQDKHVSNHISNLSVLYLNKFVSNFGTDWIRPIFVMFSFGFLASFLYILFSNNPTLFIFEQYPISTKDILLWTGGGFFISIVIYLLYYYKKWWLFILFLSGYIGILIFNQDLRLITNDISKLINPLNIFKGKEYFEDIAPYGMFVKLIMATLIYQFIMAFRQNTRRK